MQNGLVVAKRRALLLRDGCLSQSVRQYGRLSLNIIVSEVFR
jgi:hypothetical protein